MLHVIKDLTKLALFRDGLWSISHAMSGHSWAQWKCIWMCNYLLRKWGTAWFDYLRIIWREWATFGLFCYKQERGILAACMDTRDSIFQAALVPRYIVDYNRRIGVFDMNPVTTLVYRNFVTFSDNVLCLRRAMVDTGSASTSCSVRHYWDMRGLMH